MSITTTQTMSTSEQAGKKAPRHLNTTINYFDDPGYPLAPIVIGSPDFKPTPKIASPVLVTDVTGTENQYNLDVNGFQFVKHTSRFAGELAGLKSRYSATEALDGVTQAHYDEMEKLLREVLAKTRYPKPSSVHMMTHILREGPKDGEESRGTAGPLYGVHVDQSVLAATGTADRWLGEKAKELMKKPRFQIINLWRPVKPITRDPFAVTDAMTVPDSDIVAVPLVFPDHTAEALECRPAADPAKPHRWYYMSEQQPDDVLLFIQVDSTKRTDMPRRCPHAAFTAPPLEADNGEGRISIEVRAMVFYDED